LYRRRSLLLRQRPGGAADRLGRPLSRGRRQGRAADPQDPDALFRHRQGQCSEIPGMADPGLRQGREVDMAVRPSGLASLARLALVAVIGFAGAALEAAPSRAGAMLDAIRQRGTIRCGVNAGAPGYAAPASDGSWKGFNVDLCRGLAVALFKDPGKIAFVP